MTCPTCDRKVLPGQKFCTGCGISLSGITDATEIVEVIPDDADGADWADPVWAPTGSLPTQPRATIDPPVEAPTGSSTGELAATEPITEVVMDHSFAPTVDDTQVLTPYDFVEDEPAAVTTALPVSGPPGTVGGTTTMMPTVTQSSPPPATRFRVTAVTLIGVAVGIMALISMFTNLLAIDASRRLVLTDSAPDGFRTGTWIADDLASNLSIAGLLAAIMMVAGGVASAFGWRWGGGLAGGGGLSFAGIAAVTIGLAQMPIDAAHEFAQIPNETPFTLTITRDLGYWLLVVAAAAGIVLFFASINDAVADRRPGLNPWISALGALAVVITSAGPLLPENLAVFSDNWYLIEAPGQPSAMLLIGRLIQLGLLLIGGLLGFLSVRRYGIGLAVGGSLPILWLAASTLFDLTDQPIGPAFRNPGATGMHLHGVTIIGVSALASMLVLATIAAYDQGVRERP